MKDKKKWIIGISACVLLMVSVFFVFNQGKSNEQVVTEYFELLKKKDYKQMYQMLNPKIVYTPTQKYFVEKYKEFYEEIDAKNIQIKVLNEKDNIIKYQISMDTIAGKIKYKNKFDFSCAYATYSKSASFVARSASKNSCLWVHSEYMQMFGNNKEKYIKFFNEVKAKEFKNIVFVSENAKNIFDKTFSNDSNLIKKTRIIHNLMDAEEILQKSKESVQDYNKENIYTFLNVGRHTEEDKKLTRLIKAAKKLNEDKLNFRILLVGSGNKTEEYKQMVKEYGLEDKIIFLGKKQNPYPYFKIADSLILTSEYEGFPVVYLEAMLLELPIITTDVSDSLKVVKNKYGIVTKKDINSIYIAMKQAIEQGVFIKEKFNYKEYNKEIEQKLEKLINL